MSARLSTSVALCTFNGARFIQEQIRSILDQETPVDEIVVRDDRSDDNTVALIGALAATTAIPIRVTVNQDRLGSTRNFLTAIEHCRGDVIFLSDQDDVWLAEKVATMTAAFAADAEVELVLSDATVVDEALRPLGYTVLGSLPLTARDRTRVRRGDGTDLVLVRPFGTGSSMAFRATLSPAILQLNWPDALIHDSWILTVADALSRLEVIDRPLNLYRQHAAQQVGAPPKWRARAAEGAAGQPAPERLPGHRRQLGVFRQIEAAFALTETRAPFRATLRDAIAHLERRLGLPGARPLRLPGVAREVVGGGYSRFASGLRSAGRDLLLP